MIDEKTFRGNLLMLFDKPGMHVAVVSAIRDSGHSIDEIMIVINGFYLSLLDELKKAKEENGQLIEQLKTKKGEYVEQYLEEMMKLKADNEDWKDKFTFVRGLLGGQI